MSSCWWTTVPAALLLLLYAAAAFEEEDWGEGLRVLTTFQPEECEHRARKSDVIHYHYVGKLGDSGETFGKSFDYNSPYIVSLGHGRIIAGMDRGLANMCLWERRRITIPPHLGYGDRGVGQVIPPNSTLVFYVRLIKIERNGHSLGQNPSINELWRSAMDSYSDNQWQEVVDLIEEALRLYTTYEAKTLECLKMCRNAASDLGLSTKEQEVVERYAAIYPVVQQFLVYAARSQCVRECKMEKLPPRMRSPGGEVLRVFRHRDPYSYLHFSYYQLGNIEEGARCLFTYYFHHPDSEMATSSAVYYRNELALDKGQFISREPGTQPHHKAFRDGKLAYDEENWLEATDHFEEALKLYASALDTCHLLCEDQLLVNLTQKDMNPEKWAKFLEYDFVPDSVEFYPLLETIVREELRCRVGCRDVVATINGELDEGYFSRHFNYLQFSYYKLGMMTKAAESAATFIAMEPSDEVMANNIRYYTTQSKVPPETFVPRQEFVSLHERFQLDEEILHLSEHRVVRKKQGMRGDDAHASREGTHQEL